MENISLERKPGTCAICGAELEGEAFEVEDLPGFIVQVKICPKCRIVYKEE